MICTKIDKVFNSLATFKYFKCELRVGNRSYFIPKKGGLLILMYAVEIRAKNINYFQDLWKMLGPPILSRISVPY